MTGGNRTLILCFAGSEPDHQLQLNPPQVALWDGTLPPHHWLHVPAFCNLELPESGNRRNRTDLTVLAKHCRPLGTLAPNEGFTVTSGFTFSGLYRKPVNRPCHAAKGNLRTLIGHPVPFGTLPQVEVWGVEPHLSACKTDVQPLTPYPQVATLVCTLPDLGQTPVQWRRKESNLRENVLQTVPHIPCSTPCHRH